VEERHRLLLARIKLKPLPGAWNSHTKAKGALKNFMDTNIYLNAILFYRLARRSQKQKAVPEPEFKPFERTYLTCAPAKRSIIRKTQAGSERRGTMYLTPSRRRMLSGLLVVAAAVFEFYLIVELLLK
jgi:hypothetical protein